MLSSDVIKCDIQAILQKKNLYVGLFDKNDAHLSLDSPLSEHVAWAYHHIYSVPYPRVAASSNAVPNEIGRLYHGISHVTSTARLVMVFANLYRKHGLEGEQPLTDEAIKLLQISALLHDAAREDDGEDRWDHESGLILYYYLTRILGISPEKAKQFAEATANKDEHKEGYFDITENEDGVFTKRISPTKPKNLYQKLIHDGDCLEIIRARPHFDVNYLDFYEQFREYRVYENHDTIGMPEKQPGSIILTPYKFSYEQLEYTINCFNGEQIKGLFPLSELYPKKVKSGRHCSVIIKTNEIRIIELIARQVSEIKQRESNPERNKFVDDLSPLIVEEKRMVFYRGDQYNQLDLKRKMAFEYGDCWQALEQHITPQKYPMIYALNQRLLSVEELEYLPDFTTPANNELQYKLNRGQLLLRGISMPTKVQKVSSQKQCSHAELELLKILRRSGMETPSSKANNRTKVGNPSRSLVKSGFGTPAFSEVGCFISNINLSSIMRVFAVDSDSSHGKKAHYRNETISRSEIISEYNRLLHIQRLGGRSRFLDKVLSTHNELLYHIIGIDGFYFTTEAVVNDEFYNVNQDWRGPQAAFLQAVFLKQLYERLYDEKELAYRSKWGMTAGQQRFEHDFGGKRSLPIYYFSSIDNQVNRCDELDWSDEALIQKWLEMCVPSMKHFHFAELEEIKKIAMYGYYSEGEFIPADSLYSESLRTRLQEALMQQYQLLNNEFVDQCVIEIEDNPPLLFTIHRGYYYGKIPALQARLSDKIPGFIQGIINDSSNFSEVDKLQCGSKTFLLENVYEMIKALNLTDLQQQFDSELLQRLYACCPVINSWELVEKVRDYSVRFDLSVFIKPHHKNIIQLAQRKIQSTPFPRLIINILNQFDLIEPDQSMYWLSFCIKSGEFSSGIEYLEPLQILLSKSSESLSSSQSSAISYEFKTIWQKSTKNWDISDLQKKQNQIKELVPEHSPLWSIISPVINIKPLYCIFKMHLDPLINEKSDPGSKLNDAIKTILKAAKTYNQYNAQPFLRVVFATQASLRPKHTFLKSIWHRYSPKALSPIEQAIQNALHECIENEHLTQANVEAMRSDGDAHCSKSNGAVRFF